MKILAFESSCDETAVAVVEDGRRVLSDAIASQADLHALYGGVVPELASRKHIEAISGLADKALADAELSRADLDAVAVTYAPGLIGAVLVGVNFAKGAAMALDLPLIPVHHVRGHIAANYITHPDLEPPFVCLCVSGGTTAIVDVRSYTEMEIMGSTRDDAAGECFDKVARVLGIGYPGGAPMDRLAQGGDDLRYELPLAHVTGHELDMSFSGLKTASLNLIHNAQQKGEPLDLPSFAASFGRAVSQSLVPRAMAAAKANPGKYNYATHGALSTQRLFMSRLLKAFPGVDLPHVSYTSGHEVSTALLGRHVTSGFGVTTNQKPYVLSGDFTMIGVSSPERLAEFPDVPTFAEQIGPEYTFASSHGLVAPKRVPEDRILTMQNLVKEALADPDVQAKFAKAGLTTDYLSAEDFQKALDNMWKTIGDIMRENKFN